MEKLTLEVLKNAVTGNAAAFRQRVRLQPAGGPGSKVFPPTHSGGVYAWEKRRVGPDEVVNTVLLDSVQSQANRMEQALLEANRAGDIAIPIIETDFSRFPDIGVVTTLDAPHRIADAIFRDSLLNGVKFRNSDVGRAFVTANIRNASALYRYCPTALIFGTWDSTGSAGGLGNKFQRALVSEIVGFKAEKRAFHGGVRIDPLGIKAIDVYEKEDGDWVNDSTEPQIKRNAKGEPVRSKPSEFNHSNIVINSDKDGEGDYLRGGVTFDYALRTTVLSLPALRRLRFPRDGQSNSEQDEACRTVLAALALAAVVHNHEQGYDLRSRCLLIPEGETPLELVAADGREEHFEVTASTVSAILKAAVTETEKTGVTWQKETIRLVPEPKLIQLVERSRTSTLEE